MSSPAQPRPRMPRAAPVALMLLALCACAASRPAEEVGADEETAVRVENRAWPDMTIYADVDGQRVRLGSVTGSTTRVLRIPSRVIGLGRDVVFIADPVGSGRTASSYRIYVRPGDEVVITIPSTAG